MGRERRLGEAGWAVYRLQPARIVLIDNTKGFGHEKALKIYP
jgi:hypothetical protein